MRSQASFVFAKPEDVLGAFEEAFVDCGERRGGSGLHDDAIYKLIFSKNLVQEQLAGIQLVFVQLEKKRAFGFHQDVDGLQSCSHGVQPSR